MDGIDAALFEISPNLHNVEKKQNSHNISLQTKLLADYHLDFSPVFAKNLAKLIATNEASLETICRLNQAIAELFAECTNNLLKKHSLSYLDVDLIGSHGQTIWHAPQTKSFWGIDTAYTFQLGDPSLIAAKTGITTVGDFRTKDMAYGGQGAPLVAYADQVLLGHLCDKNNCLSVLNIGGIANLTVLDENGKAVLAFDTGPGNMLIDRACMHLFNQKFDAGGKIADQGQIIPDLLNEILNLPYFKKLPPKTTGREDFGFSLADHYINTYMHNQSDHLGKRAYDIVATFTAVTAKSIADSYINFIATNKNLKVNKVIVAGGGANNNQILKNLQTYWPHPVDIHRHEDYGISSQYKECLLFALLAYTTYFSIPNNVPVCTGAKALTTLGKICPA
jgi:anhydro-N-acetylmuramic acid kinase